MNQKSLTKLEYNKIIELLTEQAASFGGQSRCRRLKPMTDIVAITKAQEETQDPNYGKDSVVTEPASEDSAGGPGESVS